MEDDANDRWYLEGRKGAFAEILRHCMGQIGQTQYTIAEVLTVERVETLKMLRQVCERFGDNDWPDNLHLADVIEKHLMRHLEANRGDPEALKDGH